MTSSPRSPNLLWSSFRCGTAALQGPHQVAKNSNSTSLPANSSKFAGPSFQTFANSKDGATVPLASWAGATPARRTAAAAAAVRMGMDMGRDDSDARVGETSRVGIVPP